MIALLIALSGTAVAASQALPKNSVGTKQLKNNAVTSAKIKNNQVTGADVNEATLGKVPSAQNADHATAADSATNATNATNATDATNAGNAGTVGGYHANELSRLAVGTADFPTTTAGNPVLTVNITTAGPGKSLLHAIGSGYAIVSGGTYPCEPYYWLSVDGSAIDFFSVSVYTASASGELFTIANQHVVSVSPGNHTVSLMFAGNNAGTCTTATGRVRLAVQAVPFGGTGSPPAGPAVGPMSFKGARGSLQGAR
jgi:hypothetical protein